jgi:hypothetical protein
VPVFTDNICIFINLVYSKPIIHFLIPLFTQNLLRSFAFGLPSAIGASLIGAWHH